MTSSQLLSSGNSLRPGGYCNSIQKVRLLPCLKKSVIFLQQGNLSSSSRGSEAPSSCSSESDASFKDCRAEAASSLKDIAGRIFRDGYTRSLIIHDLCGVAARRDGGAELALQTVFADLDVAWVLDLETGKIESSKILDQEPAALDSLVERWSRALTVMAKVFHITWSDLQDQKLGVVPAEKMGSCSAPAAPQNVLAAASDSLSSESWSGISARRLSAKCVREAMTAYSLCKTIEDAEQDEEGQFAGFAQASVLRMLAFAEAIAGVERAPENLLRTLDAYASVSDSAPLLLQMFTGLLKDSVSGKIERTSRLLSDAVRAMMTGAKASIVAHVSASPGTHSHSECDVLEAVRCAMDDITLLFHNYGSLNIFPHQDEDCGDDGGCMFDYGGISTLSYLIVELISCLEDSIEEKSRTYSDRNLMYIFLLNNSHYMLERVEAMDLFYKTKRTNLLMREPTDLEPSVVVRKQKIESYIKAYLETSWLPLTSYLSVPRDYWPYGTGSGRYSSLKKFNSEFKRTYDTQRLWKVPNPQLRKRLRESISSQVIQGYTSYLHNHPGSEKSGIHTPKEMKQFLAELFEG